MVRGKACEKEKNEERERKKKEKKCTLWETEDRRENTIWGR